MKELYRSFEGKLDMDTRSGHIISGNINILKIEYLNIDTDERDRVTYLYPTDTYNIDAVWSDALVERLLDDLHNLRLDVAGKYFADSRYLAQREYDLKNNLVTKTFKLPEQVVVAFVDACKHNDTAQVQVIGDLMQSYVAYTRG